MVSVIGHTSETRGPPPRRGSTQASLSAHPTSLEVRPSEPPEIARRKQLLHRERPYQVPLTTNTAVIRQGAQHQFQDSPRKERHPQTTECPSIQLEDFKLRALIKPLGKADSGKGELLPETTDKLLPAKVDHFRPRPQSKVTLDSAVPFFFAFPTNLVTNYTMTLFNNQLGLP